MKFSWKLCVSVLALSMAVTGIGGYALLSALFQSAYRREIKSAAEENRMLQYSFAAYCSPAGGKLRLSGDGCAEDRPGHAGGDGRDRASLSAL